MKEQQLSEEPAYSTISQSHSALWSTHLLALVIACPLPFTCSKTHKTSRSSFKLTSGNLTWCFQHPSKPVSDQERGRRKTFGKATSCHTLQQQQCILHLDFPMNFRKFSHLDVLNLPWNSFCRYNAIGNELAWSSVYKSSCYGNTPLCHTTNIIQPRMCYRDC